MEIKDILNKQVAIHTPTLEIYRKVLEELQAAGVRWCGGELATEKNENVLHYGEHTCLTAWNEAHPDKPKISYCGKEWFEREGYTVYEWNETVGNNNYSIF